MEIQITSTPNLNRFAQELSQLSESLVSGFNWESLIPVIQAGVEGQFASEGGGQWPALSLPYAAWKASRYPGKGILQREGVYLRAATTRGAPYNFVEIGDDSIRWGVEGLDYAAFHETGAGNLPQRAVFSALAGDEAFGNAVTQTFRDWIARRLADA